MPQYTDDTPPGQMSLETAEARMRRALNFPANGGNGHGGSPQPDIHPPRTDSRAMDTGNRRRSRFVQDGEIPVTIVNRSKTTSDGVPSTSRLAVAEAALSTERTIRVRAERALAEAQATIHELRTRQSHQALALREATESARLNLEAAAAEHEQVRAALLQDIAAERALRLAAEAALQDALAVAQPVEAPEPPVVAAPVRKTRTATVKVKRVAAPKKPRVAAPKPVKWWIK